MIAIENTFLCQIIMVTIKMEEIIWASTKCETLMNMRNKVLKGSIEICSCEEKGFVKNAC